MAASSSSSVCRGDLAGAVPGLGQVMFVGSSNRWTWRARVADAVYNRKTSAEAAVPREVEAKSPIEMALNRYSYEEALGGFFLRNLLSKGCLFYMI